MWRGFHCTLYAVRCTLYTVHCIDIDAGAPWLEGLDIGWMDAWVHGCRRKQALVEFEANFYFIFLAGRTPYGAHKQSANIHQWGQLMELRDRIVQQVGWIGSIPIIVWKVFLVCFLFREIWRALCLDGLPEGL